MREWVEWTSMVALGRPAGWRGAALVSLVSILGLVPGQLGAQAFGVNEPVDPLSDYADDYLATYPIIALDRATGQLGMRVQSKAFGAGNRAMTAKGGVAMVAHQASANPMYGPMSIELIERGYSPEEALDQLVRGDEGRDRRQNAIIDIEGRTAAWTGESTSDWAGHHCGVDYCAQGNIFAGSAVVDAMVASFESSSGPLAEQTDGRARRGSGGRRRCSRHAVGSHPRCRSPCSWGVPRSRGRYPYR